MKRPFLDPKELNVEQFVIFVFRTANRKNDKTINHNSKLQCKAFS